MAAVVSFSALVPNHILVRKFIFVFFIFVPSLIFLFRSYIRSVANILLPCTIYICSLLSLFHQKGGWGIMLTKFMVLQMEELHSGTHGGDFVSECETELSLLYEKSSVGRGRRLLKSIEMTEEECRGPLLQG